MVKMRLQRFGRKKRPYYRIIVQDSRKKRDGKYLESLGYYHPLEKEHKCHLHKEKILYWHSRGAQATDRVKSLLKGNGIELYHK